MWRNLRSALRSSAPTESGQAWVAVDVVAGLARALLEHDLDTASDEVLGDLCLLLRGERCSWSWRDTGGAVAGRQWSCAGVAEGPTMTTAVAGCEDELLGHLSSGTLLLTDIDDLPADAEVLGQVMARRSVRSAVLVPVVEDRRVRGWLTLETVTRAHTWDEREIDLLNRVAELFAAATQRFHHDQELKVLTRAVEQNPASVVIVDREWRIEYANPQHCRSEGREVDELVGQKLEFEHHPEVPEGIYADLWGAVESGRQWRGDLVRSGRDGESLWEAVTIRPLRSAAGTVDRHLIIMEDVSDRRRAEASLARAREKADEASRAKSEFLANMSHELRTPVNAIIGLSRLTLQTELSERQHDHLAKIRDSAQHLLGIISAILDYSIIDAGRMAIETFDFHLDDVLENLTELLEGKARDRGLELTVATASDVPRDLRGDPFRIGQVLINLGNNAIKFSDRGEVAISCTAMEVDESSAVLRFSVRDTGIGISADDIGRLFDPFTQVDGSLTRPHGGTGLGLAIARRLVELMGGEIGVTSTPGEGSEFYFTVRLRRQHGPSLPLPVPHPDLRGMRVLVVDDSRTARRTLCETLQAFTFEPTSVASAEEALAELHSALEGPAPTPYDLVLMDWKMPTMDGLEAARRIKSSPHPSPRIILVTGYGREDVIHQADRELLDGFLLKPINASLLFDSIMNAVGRERPGAETPAPPVAAEAPLPSAGGGRVLVVEDNFLNQEVAEELLTDMGLEVTLADNGEEALERLRVESFDLVLMDVQMPLMDGFEATREIRADPDLAHLPIVAMTAHAMTGDRERCLEAGMDDYVSKPIDTDRLFEVLSRWLKPQAPTPIDLGDGPEPDDGLPAALPGINIGAGLSRVGGNRVLFRRLLGEFLHDYRDVVRTIRTAVELGHEESGLRLLHTLKGVAATLGADGVHVAARDLEAGLQSAPLDHRKALLGNLERALAPVLAGLQSVVEDSTGGAGQGAETLAVDVASVRPKMVELLLLLEDGDPEAGDKVGDLVQALAGTAHTQQAATLERLIQNFDFDDAVAALTELSEAIGFDRGAED